MKTKNMIQALTALSVALVGWGASAGELAIQGVPGPIVPETEGSILRSEILQADIDPELEFGSFMGGSVQLDREAGQLTLTLRRSRFCRPGTPCPMWIPAPMIVTLPIAQQFVNRCGSLIVVAKKDARPVDGSLQELRIIDHTQNRCPTLIPLPAVETTYVTESAGFGGPVVKTLSKFVGDDFVNVPTQP